MLSAIFHQVNWFVTVFTCIQRQVYRYHTFLPDLDIKLIGWSIIDLLSRFVLTILKPVYTKEHAQEEKRYFTFRYYLF